jgi:anti-sigma B factor antagonist
MTGQNGSLRIQQSACGIQVSGDIDAHSVVELAEHLEPLPGGAGDIVVDLSGVEFVDSSGLRVLVATHQRAERDERRLVLRNPSRPVLRLLAISGLSHYLHVDPPVEADATAT